MLPHGPFSWIGLVLNERGLDRAIRAGVHEVNVVVVATDTFSQRNQGVTTDEAIAAWTRIADRARAAGLRTTVTIAASFGCPFEGGVGGCPFAPAATGNIATEDLLYLLDRSAVRTGVSATALAPATDLLASTLGKPVPGLFAKAGPFPPAAGQESGGDG